MGRAARECTEPRRYAPRGSRRPRSGCATAGSNRLGVAVAAVDPGLEAAADVLARCEERVVADAPRRQLDDRGLTRRGRRDSVHMRPPHRGASGDHLPPKPCHTRTPTMSRAPVGTRPAGRVPHFADETSGEAQLQGLHDHGLQSRPEATKYRWAALACASAESPCPKRRRSVEPIWNRPRYWPFWASVLRPDSQRETARASLAVVAEDAADDVARRGRLDRRRAGELCCARVRAPIFAAAAFCWVRGEAHRVKPLLALRLDRESGVAEQPLCVSRKWSTCSVLLHRAQVARQLRAEVCVGLRLGGRRQDQQNQGAHTHR